MNDEEFEFVQGQISAITSTLAVVISTMPQLSAAQAALQLAVTQETDNMEDAANGTSERHASSRNSMLSAFVELLQSASSRG